jgi:glycosyltransferase involved in cell wall biosynthesis
MKLRLPHSLVPLSLRTSVYERLSRAKFERLRRAKNSFRKANENGSRRSAGVPQGVNLVAYIRAEMGLGVAARGMASALRAADIPFNVINLETGNYSRHNDLSWSHKEARRSDYDVTIVCVNPDNSFNLRTHVPLTVLGDRYVIGYWFWELPEMPDEWMSEFEFTDEVWAATNFIKDAVASKSPAPVIRIPPVVLMGQGKNLSRADLGLPENRFVFLAMFDAASVLQRKNPLGVLHAFKRAFAADDARVALVLKFNNPDSREPVLHVVREESASHENVFLLDQPMDKEEVISLIKASDCFVSLHRSEGFGLGPAEAMSLGKPAIITNWSGNTDYMTADNCIPIDYELVKLGQDYGPYKAHQHWAEPDLEQAAHWMKRLVLEPELARTIGFAGQQTINLEFSPSVVGKLIQDRLRQIRTLP